MNATVLLVFPPDRASKLQRLLDGCGVQTSLASNIEEARQKLVGSSSYDLVLTDAELPDGSWHDLLQFVLESGKSFEVIVSSWFGDENLWTEVLRRGAYDLLAEPYDRRKCVGLSRALSALITCGDLQSIQATRDVSNTGSATDRYFERASAWSRKY